MLEQKEKNNFLTGKILVAMPTMEDPRFKKSVIYVCAHTEDGAMGLVINRPIEELRFSEILKQLGIATKTNDSEIEVYSGGPVESARGFVLHSPEYKMDGTVPVDNNTSLSATMDILVSIANGSGPRQYLMTLGYAGWTGGQLEDEVKNNTWLSLEADNEILWKCSNSSKWESALKKLGVEPGMLVSEFGTA